MLPLTARAILRPFDDMRRATLAQECAPRSLPFAPPGFPWLAVRQHCGRRLAGCAVLSFSSAPAVAVALSAPCDLPLARIAVLVGRAVSGAARVPPPFLAGHVVRKARSLGPAIFARASWFAGLDHSPAPRRAPRG